MTSKGSKPNTSQPHSSPKRFYKIIFYNIFLLDSFGQKVIFISKFFHKIPYKFSQSIIKYNENKVLRFFFYIKHACFLKIYFNYYKYFYINEIFKYYSIRFLKIFPLLLYSLFGIFFPFLPSHVPII